MEYTGITEAWEKYLEDNQKSAYMQRLSLKEDERLFMEGFKSGFEAASNFNVSRLEVIDHTPNGEGRAYIKIGDITGEIQLQDFGETFKIFLK